MSGLTRNKVLWFEPFETIKSELESLKNVWYNSIWFLWWEPTIHPNFLDFILISKKLGFENIEVITNWSTFDKKEYLQEAITNGLTRVSISFHSILEAEESVLTWWIKGIVRKKLKAVQNTLYEFSQWRLWKELSINIVISKLNYKTIKKTILFLYKFWVKTFRLNFIQLEWYSTFNPEVLALRYEEFTPYLLDILHLCKENRDLRINFEAIPWCFSGLTHEEYLKYCEHKMDNEKHKISRNDIDLVSRDIVHQYERRKELKKYIKKCEQCVLKNECEWIWARYLKHFEIKPL